MRCFNRLKEVYEEGVAVCDASPDATIVDSIRASSGAEIGEAVSLYTDAVYAFFLNCWHLQDWIKNDRKVSLFCGITKSEFESFGSDLIAKGNYCMEICHEICLGSKHFKPSKPNTDDWPVADPYQGGAEFYLRDGKALIKTKCTIEFLGVKYDALDLAEECVEKWNEFMKLHNLPTQPGEIARR